MAFEVTARILPRTTEEFDEMLDPIQEKHPGSGRNLKWVLIALSDYSNKEGFCWPSVKSIELFTGLSTRSIQRALKQAQVLGMLKIRRRNDASSQYMLVLERLPFIDRPPSPKEKGPHSEIGTWDEPDLFEGGQGGTPATVAHTPRHGGTPPVPGSHPPGATVAPKPIIEPVIEPVREPSGAQDAPDVDTKASSPGRNLQPRGSEPPLPVFVQEEWKRLKEQFPEMGDCRSITESMARLVRDRAKEHAQTGESLHDVWRTVFGEIRNSRFLTGQLPPSQGRNSRFHLTLSRLLKPHIFREAINGGYANSRADDGSFDPRTGEVLGPAAAATRGTIERFRNARQRAGAG